MHSSNPPAQTRPRSLAATEAPRKDPKQKLLPEPADLQHLPFALVLPPPVDINPVPVTPAPSPAHSAPPPEARPITAPGLQIALPEAPLAVSLAQVSPPKTTAAPPVAKPQATIISYDGMPAAQHPLRMTMARQQDKIAHSEAQLLPEASALNPFSPAAFASASASVPHESVSETPAPLPPFVSRAAILIEEQAIRVRTSAPGTLCVVLQPAPGTQVLLYLLRTARGLEADLRVQGADAADFREHWPELTRLLARHQISLRPLPASAAEHVPGKARTRGPSSQRRAWESWA